MLSYLRSPTGVSHDGSSKKLVSFFVLFLIYVDLSPQIQPKYCKVSAIVNSLNNESSCGMYPTLGPGTPLPSSPGLPPNTHNSPELSLLRPTMHVSRVVFPQPEAPNNPYLKKSREEKVFLRQKNYLYHFEGIKI